MNSEELNKYISVTITKELDDVDFSDDTITKYKVGGVFNSFEIDEMKVVDTITKIEGRKLVIDRVIKYKTVDSCIAKFKVGGK